MQARNSKAILVIRLMLAVGFMPMTWMGCASTATRETAGEYLDDSTITAKVKAAFVHDPVVRAFDVSVQTYRGAVQLSGFVNTFPEKIRAEAVARRVNGVKSVANSLIVKSQ
ncbi:MAG: BON domain-containing protein [Verrucomicrobiia bacterium]